MMHKTQADFDTP